MNVLFTSKSWSILSPDSHRRQIAIAIPLPGDENSDALKRPIESVPALAPLGVNRGTVDANFEVHMRAGTVPGASDPTNDLPAPNDRLGGNKNL